MRVFSLAFLLVAIAAFLTPVAPVYAVVACDCTAHVGAGQSISGVSAANKDACASIVCSFDDASKDCVCGTATISTVNDRFTCEKIACVGSDVREGVSVGCCLCGETANAGVAGEAACTAKCGTGVKATYIAASDCKDALADQAKGVEVKKASPIPPLRNPLGTTDLRAVLGRVVNAFLGISGSVALLMFVFGGFTWITSGGAAERIQKGKNAMIWAVIGIAFIFASYAVLNFIFRALSG